MASIENRLAKLESAAPEQSTAFEEMVRLLPPLDEHGCLAWHRTSPEFESAFVPWFTELGNQAGTYEQLPDPIERALARLLVTFNDSRDPFAYERFRGRIPDRVLAAIYNGMRNFAFNPDIALHVRQLSGVVDSAGNLVPGYVRNDDGCIAEAGEIGHG
jgi:hypothetical protein